MNPTITEASYGKQQVRLLKIVRTKLNHNVQDITVNIRFEGSFDATYLSGDNSCILPTDTMKNTVYALAKETEHIEPIPKFAFRLAKYFIENSPLARKVTVAIEEFQWAHIQMRQECSPHGFLKAGQVKRIASVECAGGYAQITSGIKNLQVLKTTNAGFAGFRKDKYTTLQETFNRMMVTEINAEWIYKTPESAFQENWGAIQELMLETFALHTSRSLQHTLYAIGNAILNKFKGIAEISLAMPNIHHWPTDTNQGYGSALSPAPYGTEDSNTVFVPVAAPYSLIEAKIKR